jgi:DNA polymerase III epsilon subunit-like protein
MTIIFSTESNSTEGDNRLLSLVWSVFNDEAKPILGRWHLIEPDGWLVSESATHLHGITTEQAKFNGINIKKVLETFIDNYEGCHTMVYYEPKDYDIIAAEMRLQNISTRKKIQNKVVLCEDFDDADIFISDELLKDEHQDLSNFMNRIIAMSKLYFKKK